MLSVNGQSLYDSLLNKLGATNVGEQYDGKFDDPLAEGLAQMLSPIYAGFSVEDAQSLIDIAQSSLSSGASIEDILEKVLELLGIEDSEKASEGGANDSFEVDDIIVASFTKELDDIAGNDGLVEMEDASALMLALGGSDVISYEEVRILIQETNGHIDDIILTLFSDEYNHIKRAI